MSYQALYRKWRPRNFGDMVGQHSTLQTLRNQVKSGHIAHAYLFCGSHGTGKTTTAKIFSLAVNCLDPQDGDACGKCANCVALSEPANMDIVEIDAASNNGVDEMRDLREKVKYPPSTGKYRVYIIDEVHMLSTGAFNALLKTLEEPPAHLVFILATTEVHKLPGTILSRVQRYDFGRIALADIVGRLREVLEEAHREASEEALYAIARAAQGALRDALSILDVVLGYTDQAVTLADVRDTLGLADESRMREYIDALLRSDAQGALRALEDMLRRGAQAAALLRDIMEELRKLILTASCGEDAPSMLEITQEEWESLRARLEGHQEMAVLRLFDIFLPLSAEMRSAARPAYILESATLRACLPAQEESLAALIARLDALEAAPRAAAPAAPQAAPRAQTRPGPEKTQPEEKAAPAAAPSAPPPPGEFDPTAIWKSAKARIKKAQISVFTMLSKAHMAAMEPGSVTIALPPELDIHKRVLEQPEKQALLETSFTEAAGQPMRVRIVLDNEEAPPAPAERTDNVALAFEMFGRENVVIRDDPPK